MSARRAARFALSFTRPVGGRVKVLQPSQVLVLGFAGAIMIGTGLLSLSAAAAPGTRISLIDAFFTATSAVCVTGLTVLDTRTAWSPFGQTVIMLLMQVGGLGIMTMSTLIALLRGKRITLSERLVIQSALGTIELAGVVRLTKAILLTTLALEGVGALILTFRFAADYPPLRALYLGVFHSISAFNNAGFDLFSTSVVGYNRDPFVLLTMAGLIIVGGIGFTVSMDLLRFARDRRKGRPSHLSLHTKLVLTLTAVLLTLGTTLVLLWEYNNPNTLGPLSPAAKVLNAFFMGTVPRTAGFNSVPMAGLREVTLFFLIMLMFVGASPGGTGGGVKTTTFGIVAMSVLSTIRGREEVEVFGRRLTREARERSLALIAIALFLITAIILILDVTEGAPILPVMFETVSAFGTVGLSMGLTSDLTAFGKLIIALTMFAGRVGPLTLVLALARARAAQRPVRFPEERIMVG